MIVVVVVLRPRFFAASRPDEDDDDYEDDEVNSRVFPPSPVRPSVGIEAVARMNGESKPQEFRWYHPKTDKDDAIWDTTLAARAPLLLTANIAVVVCWNGLYRSAVFGHATC